jgi:photosystem I P700 chlorophyll a apoprotein A2
MIALGLHTTTLILVKGALDARKKLMPDKKDFGYSFPCDGPGRGGGYLSLGCILLSYVLDVTHYWVTFYWHWKHMAIWVVTRSI